MTDDQNLPVELGFALSATFGDGGGGPDPVFSIKAGVVADVTVGLPGITICVSGIEQDITVIEFGPTATGFTFALPTWQTLTPSGSLSLDLPAISGSGEVVSAADGSWSGGLQLAMAAMAIDAYAVIGPKEPLSLAIVLCARFPPPGIQIGFGFAVSGVGGVLAVNRRSDRDALTAAILDGSIDKLLSAGDAQDDSARIIANLPALFPDSPGQVVVGPMLEITWGAGLLTADVMLIIELPNPLQISLIGRLLVDLPFDEDGDDDIAMIHLEARIAAIVTPSVPEVRIVASLNGSRILFFPITGDLFLLIRGGPEATFVFSAGGFHPAFTPPPNVPPLQRVSMTMMLALIELRLACYVAVTTSSVQVGAAVDLNASVAGCGLHGNFSFDALIDWKPEFHFLVDVHIALSVEVFSKNLCGVAFTGSLSGPGPWHLHGSGEVEVLWFSIELPIDATFGSAPPPAPPAPLNVDQLLIAELNRPESWTIRPPATIADGVTLTPTAHADLAAAKVLHPGGGLQVAERLVPLGVSIERYAGQTVQPSPTFSIRTVYFGDQQGPPTATVSDNFADGAYRALPVEQQLTVNGFSSYHAGVQITPTGLMCSLVEPPVSKAWDDIIVNGPSSTGSTLWPISGLAALVPARGPAVANTIAGNPIRVLQTPPPATAPATAVRGPMASPTWERR
ncbi:DUF6603 domain-containing protein [Mycobacterium sp.]|uniref:DUF6603 domain-containing protein n=1 Tax=Mycobacterium sp. TaxID=1785 RepID=UPI003F9B6B5F